MTIKLIRLSCLAALLGGHAADASPRCLSYGPDTVAVTGTLVRRTFYGAPGFGEDPKHDIKETGFYLVPKVPLCTASRGEDSAVAGVKLVQLVLDSAGLTPLRPKLGHTVTVRGTLSPAMSGHHHAPLLLLVRLLPR